MIGELEHCIICPRSCGVNRNKGELGYCKSGAEMHIARAALHYWEEPVISGEITSKKGGKQGGSGAVFFTGCSMGCVYCQNYDISRSGKVGKMITPAELSEIFAQLEDEGAYNINLVSAAHFVPLVREALLIHKPKIPVVYNSSGYEKVDTLKSLRGLIDIYLPDFKYALKEPAVRYSSAPDYPEVAKAAIAEMLHQCGDTVIEDGIMQKGVLIRHLVLPLNIINTFAVLKNVSELFAGTKLSLMSQYIPYGRAAEFSEINRKITAREYDKAVNEMIRLNIDGYIQEIAAASCGYIPDFDI